MKKDSWLEKAAIAVTQWIGTTQSILIHSIIFVLIFDLYFLGFALDQILLILTTAVSLEAIYLALFIQMTVNRNTEDIIEVASDIDEIQEDVEELGGEFDDIQEDVEEISSDIDRLQEPTESAAPSDKPHANSLHEQLREITTQLSRLEEELMKIQSSEDRTQ